mmetsp:Transcript_29385/g.32662  ORF Transcript_29385/g.32662 Transcript_29385/m.32662 type:complete len:152 (-) Transcript_29385:77-532(-)|eukprot:CAMPEP_0168508514 /NCGR_PEP_ID=MMETSP0405-20121227/171_1 /TAXON_ID=498012 /ORGANISM="Trichosphaerium sp, Strain Am-I-7 wt" /LENGTH=151 /DNA_ID=CAMNT_0008525687 /DNA_START=934 /DNA_END=1389 /DNA_ORIENTATION=+
MESITTYTYTNTPQKLKFIVTTLGSIRSALTGRPQRPRRGRAYILARAQAQQRENAQREEEATKHTMDSRQQKNTPELNTGEQTTLKTPKRCLVTAEQWNAKLAKLKKLRQHSLMKAVKTVKEAKSTVKEATKASAFTRHLQAKRSKARRE